MIQLTRREKEILKLLAVTASNRDLAKRLVPPVAENSIMVFLCRIFKKLGVHKRVDAIMVAVDAGLLAIEDFPWLKPLFDRAVEAGIEARLKARAPVQAIETKLNTEPKRFEYQTHFLD